MSDRKMRWRWRFAYLRIWQHDFAIAIRCVMQSALAFWQWPRKTWIFWIANWLSQAIEQELLET